MNGPQSTGCTVNPAKATFLVAFADCFKASGAASPDLWTHFADFYKRATDASRLACEASRAQRGDAFRASIAQLRAACDGCHAAYQKTD